MRINARMDEESQKALDFIKRTTGESTTVALKRAIALYAEQLENRRAPGAKMRAFLSSDFIGCVEGPEDVSASYKDYVQQALNQKYGDR